MDSALIPGDNQTMKTSAKSIGPVQQDEALLSVSKGDAARTTILTAAIKIFAQVGFQAASTRMIASEGNVHHALLRYYFADKEQLWRAAVEEMFHRQRAEFAAEQNAVPVSRDTLDGVKEMVRRYVRYCAAHPEHAQILVHEAIADTARLKWAVDKFVRANTARLLTSLEQQTSVGNMRLDDPEMTTIIFSAASQMVFVLSSHLRQIYDRDVNDPAFVEQMTDSILALLFVN